MAREELAAWQAKVASCVALYEFVQANAETTQAVEVDLTFEGAPVDFPETNVHLQRLQWSLSQQAVAADSTADG